MRKYSAFTVSDGNGRYTASSGILYDTYNTVKISIIPSGISGKVSVMSGITGINQSDFYGCTKITEIILPSTLEYIAPGAFTSCTALNSVKVMKSYGGTEDRCMTYNSSKRQMGFVSWDDSYELARLLKNTFPDRYFFGTP